jgi:hypothetical protein
LELEEDHVADLEGALNAVLVGVLLHSLLRSEKMLLHESRHGLAFL